MQIIKFYEQADNEQSIWTNKKQWYYLEHRPVWKESIKRTMGIFQRQTESQTDLQT